MRDLLTAAARKAQVAAAVAFLGPIGTYVAATGEWSWRAFAGAAISGLVGGLTVYETKNERTERV